MEVELRYGRGLRVIRIPDRAQVTVLRPAAVPPLAGTTQIWKSRNWLVKAIHLPSGDQSGSVGLPAPAVWIIWESPPPAGTFRSARRSLSFDA